MGVMPPVNLHAFLPELCERGHRLRGRNSIIATWRPCACKGVADAGQRGHQVVRCRTCDKAGVEMIYLHPPHQETETPRDAG